MLRTARRPAATPRGGAGASSTIRRNRGTSVAPCMKREWYGLSGASSATETPDSLRVMNGSATSHDTFRLGSRPLQSSASVRIAFGSSASVPLTTLGGTRNRLGFTRCRSHGVPKAILVSWAAR